jgi:hypothetical protein
MNGSAIYFNLIYLWIDLSAEIRHHLLVNSHTTFGDELLHLSPRAYTTLSEKLLKTNLCHTSPLLLYFGR